jgi:hypothetical protein
MKLTNGSWTDITDSGGFTNPYGVAVDSSGNVYVADYANNKIKELTHGSSSWTDITGSEVLGSPYGVAVDRFGNVYATDRDTNKIMELPAPTPPTDITAVSLTGVVAPVTGATPEVLGSLTSGTSEYTVASIEWENSGESSVTLDGSGNFNAGSAYQVGITLTSATGYDFPTSGLTPTVNVGTAGAGTGYGTGNTSLDFLVTFPATAVDKTALATAITNANTLIGSLTVGTAAGDVSSADAATFQAAITAAQAVDSSTTAVQADVDAQVAALATATTTFNSAVVTVAPDTDATLSNLDVDGTTVVGFAPTTTTYSVALLAGTTATPTVTTTATDAANGATAVVTQATSVTGSATVQVTAQDGTTTETYTINFSVAAATMGITFSPVSGSAITASTPIHITVSPELSTTEAVYLNTTGSTLSTSDNPYQSTGLTLSVSGTVYAAVYDSSARSWSDQASATYTVGSAAISVASQVGMITAGTAGSATFAVTTNIANGTAVSIGWCDSSGAAAATPPGLSAAGTKVANGVLTITVTADAAAVAGTYCFTATSDGVTSSMVTVTVSPYTIISSGGGGGGVTSLYPPAVQTDAASTITATSAVLNGDITSDDGFSITDYGFIWGTSANAITNKLDVGANNQSGAFMGTLSNLTTGTTYYFEAYATNSYGTSDDGAVMSFTAGVPTTTQTTTTTPSTPSTGTAFSDVSASYWGYDAISSLSSKGIVSGYPDGTFLPDASITRAEFATMLAKALRLNTNGTTGTFTDVTAGAWYYGSVNATASAGLVSGPGDNLFAPTAPVYREQMAVMVAKALGNKAPATNGTELNAFSDKSAVSSWAVSGMDEAVEAGIVSGMTADTLVPLANATRVQAAAMIYQLLHFLGK